MAIGREGPKQERRPAMITVPASLQLKAGLNVSQGDSFLTTSDSDKVPDPRT